MTVETDLKTAIETVWNAARSTAISLNRTVYVLLDTDPAATDLEQPTIAANYVIIVILPASGLSVPVCQNCREWTYTGDVVIHANTNAQLKSAINELIRTGDLTTTGFLLFDYPSMTSDYSEGEYVTSVSWSWRKIVAKQT